MDFDRWIKRHLARRSTENAQPSLLRSILRDGKAQDHRPRGSKDGAVSVGQHDQPIDQLSVASVLNGSKV